MLIVLVCIALALCGLALMVAWRRLSLTPPDAAELGASAGSREVQPSPAESVPATAPVAVPPGSPLPAPAASAAPPASAAPASPNTPPAPAGPAQRVRAALRRYLWWATVVTVACFGTALLWSLPASRLVMRVLALTSPHAEGSHTEAEALVGTISVDGTLSLLIFGVLPNAFLSAVLFALIHRWLPRGWLGGLIFGSLLLVVAAPIDDPLRARNPDFAFLGPGWLAVLLFTVLVLGHGMLLAAVFGWYSRRLPLRPARPWLAYAPLLAAVVYIPIGVLLLIGAGATALGALIVPAVGRWWVSRSVALAGRIALALLTLLALPGFITAVITIAAR
ncbi:hypothetical protein [Microterricola viridarii]|uniref:Uncharacterized protein n=1 Tax=Microterricola viridarii TaxID=412690 RepID=A0A1H1Y4V1_9MICO|nr:hypothetical protein [Microterricola viridarii]SDT16056.1 hypothetical protein SAMN04489834_2968 [Microterricola viridarii]